MDKVVISAVPWEGNSVPRMLRCAHQENLKQGGFCVTRSLCDAADSKFDCCRTRYLVAVVCRAILHPNWEKCHYSHVGHTSVLGRCPHFKTRWGWREGGCTHVCATSAWVVKDVLQDVLEAQRHGNHV